MGRLNINWKRVLAGGLAGLIPFTFAGCSQSKEGEIVTNSIGYSHVRTLDQMGLDEDRFAVIDIGDHNTVGTTFQRTKLKMLNEKGVCLGVVISSDSEDEAGIYDDVEYAKSIVRDYEVKFPVYLNIDDIITNDNLNNEMKTKLIKNFLEKCAANNIYVGLHGTDTNLCRVKEYCKITGFDALVVKEKDEITYDGPYTIYQDLDGTLYSSVDLERVILGKGLNDAESFANDGSYTISSEAELTDAALRCGMSVSELLEFNGLRKNDIVEGTVLRIPSQINTTVPQGEETYKELGKPSVGCDMSYAQGTDVEWDKMGDYFDFIILRSNIGLTEDDCFATNAQQAALADVPVGAYCFNAYSSDDFESHEDFIKKQQQQADYTISVLKNKKIEYPVYLDIEGLVNSSTYKKEDVQAMLDIWVDTMTKSGYLPGLYCNNSTFRYLSNCVDYDIAEKLEVWIAGGPQYSSTEGNCNKHDHISLSEIKGVSEEDREKTNATMFQRTNIGKVTDSEGNVIAGDSRNHLDINLCFVDYTDKEALDQAEEDAKFAIKEFNRVDWAGIGINGASALASIAVIAGGVMLAIKKSKEHTSIKVKPKKTQKVKVKVKQK